jgi:hypothetical protein
VQATVDAYKVQLGKLNSITLIGGDQELAFANGSLLASIVLDAQGKIAGLLLQDEVDAANQAALERVLRAANVSADWFSPNFLAQIPVTQIDTVLAGFRSQQGAFRRVVVRTVVLFRLRERREPNEHLARRRRQDQRAPLPSLRPKSPELSAGASTFRGG